MARLDNKLTDSKQKKAPGGYKPEPMPAQIAEAVNERNAQAALDKLDAMTQELAQDSASDATSDVTSDAVLDGLIPLPELPELPEPGIVPKAKKAPTASLAQQGRRKEPDFVIPKRDRTKAHNDVTIPAGADKFIKDALKPVQLPAIPSFSKFVDMIEYRDKLNALQEELLLCGTFAPAGWVLEYIEGQRSVDVRDILTMAAGNTAGNYSENLYSIIRWALGFQRGLAKEDVQRRLLHLSAECDKADAVLKAKHGEPLLWKWLSLVALMQTRAYAGKPDNLAEDILSDYQYFERGTAYRTPLAELTTSAALYNPEKMTTECFVKAGSISNCMRLHDQKLMDGYSIRAGILLPTSQSIAVNTKQAAGSLILERTRSEIGAPVKLLWNVQEQVRSESTMTQDGIVESWHDFSVGGFLLQGGELSAVPAQGGSFSTREPVLAAIEVLRLLDAQGK